MTRAPTARRPRRRVTFTLKASDAGGVTSATLYWRKPGAHDLRGGPDDAGRWFRPERDMAGDPGHDRQRDHGRGPADLLRGGARCQRGARTRPPSSGTQVVTVNVCVNTGPTFADGPTAGNSTIYADPLNTGCGSPIGTEIRATITDIDGVASATLVFTDQGGTVVQRPMTGVRRRPLDLRRSTRTTTGRRPPGRSPSTWSPPTARAPRRRPGRRRSRWSGATRRPGSGRASRRRRLQRGPRLRLDAMLIQARRGPMLRDARPPDLDSPNAGSRSRSPGQSTNSVGDRPQSGNVTGGAAEGQHLHGDDPGQR